MITETYPKRSILKQIFPVPYKGYTPPVVDKTVLGLTQRELVCATKRNITPAEFKRREDLIKAELANSTFKVGDVVDPRHVEAQSKYGKCRITRICQNYLDYGDEDWPKSDCPFLLSFQSEDKDFGNKTFVGTINFFLPNKC